MFKNVASQTVDVFAFDYSTGAPKTGDAANLTVYLSKDDGTLTALTDTTASEISSTNAPGWYRFDVSQTESNANKLLFTGKSATANVAVMGRVIYTRPQYAADVVISSGGIVSANVTQFGGTNATSSGGRPEVNASHIAGSAVSTSTAQIGVNVVNAGGTAWGSGAITAASIASDAITAAKVADDVSTEIRDKITQRTTLRGTATTGGTTTSIPTSAMTPATSVADQLKGRIVIFDHDTTTAALRGQATDITASSASATPTLTVTALTTAPASGDTFTIV